MTAYVTAQLEVIDAEVFDQYRQIAGAALAKHGGEILSAGQATTLYDAGVGTTPAVLIAFPDAAAAHAWIDDPELVDTHALRNRGAKASLTVLEVAA